MSNTGCVYVEKLLKKFIMVEARYVYTPIASHFNLSSVQSPKTVVDMDCIP